MSVPKRSRETVSTVSRHRIAGSFAALSLAAGVLTACGGSERTSNKVPHRLRRFGMTKKAVV